MHASQAGLMGSLNHNEDEKGEDIKKNCLRTRPFSQYDKTPPDVTFCSITWSENSDVSLEIDHRYY